MNVSLLIEWLLHSELANSWFQRHALRTGDHLQARVVEVKGDGKILVDFGSFRALAEVKFPVKAGDLIPLRVAARGERLELEVRTPVRVGVDDPAPRPLIMEIRPGQVTNRFLSVAEMVMKAEPEVPEKMKAAIEKVMELLKPLDPARPPQVISKQLQAVLRNSGIFTEQKMAALLSGRESEGPVLSKPAPVFAEVVERLTGDLKFELGVIKEQTALLPVRENSTLAKPVRELAAVVEELLGKVNLQQQEIAGREQPLQVLAFVLPVKDQQGEMALKIYLPKKGQGKGRNGYRVALLLDLARLDLLRIDLHQVAADLLVTFYTRREEITTFIREHLAEIEQLLAPGFASVTMRVFTDKDQVEAFASEDLVAAESKLVDLRV